MARWTARAPATQGGQVGESTARNLSLCLPPLKRSLSGCSEPANVTILDVPMGLLHSALSAQSTPSESEAKATTESRS